MQLVLIVALRNLLSSLQGVHRIGHLSDDFPVIGDSLRELVFIRMPNVDVLEVVKGISGSACLQELRADIVYFVDLGEFTLTSDVSLSVLVLDHGGGLLDEFFVGLGLADSFIPYSFIARSHWRML